MLFRNAMKAALVMVLCATLGAVAVPHANANSALDQYVEDVPNTHGNDTDQRGNGVQGTDRQNRLDPERAKELKVRDKDGEVLVAVAESNGPSAGSSAAGAGTKSGDNGSAASKSEIDDVTKRTSGATKSLTSAAGVSGLSVPLFAFVVLLAAAMGATAWYRRNRDQSS